MKLYISHSSDFDYKKELYEPIRASFLSNEHEIILPHEVYADPTDFVTRDIIKTCDLLIAEVSFPSTGQGIELGWADIAKCPIVCLYRTGSKISTSLRVVTDKFVEYNEGGELVEKIKKIIDLSA